MNVCEADGGQMFQTWGFMAQASIWLRSVYVNSTLAVITKLAFSEIAL